MSKSSSAPCVPRPCIGQAKTWCRTCPSTTSFIRPLMAPRVAAMSCRMSAHSGSESSAFNREIDRLISAAGFSHPPVGYRLFTWSEDVHFHISWMRATLSALDKPAHLVGTETRPRAICRRNRLSWAVHLFGRCARWAALGFLLTGHSFHVVRHTHSMHARHHVHHGHAGIHVLVHAIDRFFRIIQCSSHLGRIVWFFGIFDCGLYLVIRLHHGLHVVVAALHHLAVITAHLSMRLGVAVCALLCCPGGKWCSKEKAYKGGKNLHSSFHGILLSYNRCAVAGAWRRLLPSSSEIPSVSLSPLTAFQHLVRLIEFLPVCLRIGAGGRLIINRTVWSAMTRSFWPTLQPKSRCRWLGEGVAVPYRRPLSRETRNVPCAR